MKKNEQLSPEEKGRRVGLKVFEIIIREQRKGNKAVDPGAVLVEAFREADLG